MEESSPSVTARGRIELQDHLRFTFKHHYRNWVMKAGVALSVLFVLFLAVLTCTGAWSEPDVFVALGALPAYTLVLLPLGLFFWVKRALSSNKLLQDEGCYEFSDEGLVVRSSSGESRLGWDKLYRARGDSTALYLYISTAQAFVIPSRFFGDGQDMSRAVEMLRDNLTPKQFKLNWKH